MPGNPEFYTAIRASKILGPSLNEAQVRNVEHILEAFAEVGDRRDKTLAYVLATVRKEVGVPMAPVREGFMATDLAARAFVKAHGRRYAAPVPPHGHVYYGRGYVQLTWADNYKASSADAEVDLFANPDTMLLPSIGARITVLGIQDGRWNAQGHGIAYYLPTEGPDDLKGARRTVNLTDDWDEVGDFYTVFLDAVGAGGGADALAPPALEGEPLPEGVQAIVDLVVWRAMHRDWRLLTATQLMAWLEEMP